ncbi:MAG: response regulator [Candidatus Wildermuthbacteria bacterium]|nr:response regulator [Candidatus Wildermuthbacteria bacterium]
MEQQNKKNSKGKKTILVVEDDTAYANVYRRKLSKEGYDVVIEGNGDKALGVVREKKPDLILLDLVMPGKNGFEVLQEIRSHKEFDNIKIIVASNLSQDIDIEKAKHAGADDYFIKSNVSVPEMIQKVKNTLFK